MPLFGAPKVDVLFKRGDLRGLVKALRHPNAQVRRDAAAFLGGLDDVATCEPLLGATADPDPGVREAAEASLRDLRDASELERLLPPLVAALQDPQRAWGERVLTWADRKTIEESTVRLLADVGDPRVIDPLAEWLQVDDDERVRLHSSAATEVAIRALARLGDSRWVVAALRRLDIEFWYPMDDTAAHWASLDPNVSDASFQQVEYRGQRVYDVGGLREWPGFVGLFTEHPEAAIPGLRAALGYTGHGASAVRYLAERILTHELRDARDG